MALDIAGTIRERAYARSERQHSKLRHTDRHGKSRHKLQTLSCWLTAGISATRASSQFWKCSPSEHLGCTVPAEADLRTGWVSLAGRPPVAAGQPLGHVALRWCSPVKMDVWQEPRGCTCLGLPRQNPAGSVRSVVHVVGHLWDIGLCSAAMFELPKN